MTHTVSIEKRTIWGDLRVVVGRVDITSYTAAGEVLDTSDFDFAVGVTDMILSAVSENGFGCYWDGDTKIVARGTGSEEKAAGTAVDAATDVGEIPFIAIGN